jgi:3-isopropylmalate/(R)-2-methylmalate dehydratase small subunit
VSFSEIFFGNAVALGMPCVSVSGPDAKRLIAAAEQKPEERFTVNLEALSISGAGMSVPVTIPATARESFLEGTWDATGLLLDRYDQVEAVAARLPYVNGWNVPAPAAETPTPRATDPRAS